MVKMKKAPAASIFSACLRWVCIWSAEMTVSFRSGGILSRRSRKTGISFVFPWTGELGGGGAVVPETGQEHRDAAAADSAAQGLAVDPQVLSHAGARVTARVAVQGAQHVIGVLRVAGVAEDPGEGRGVRAAGDDLRRREARRAGAGSGSGPTRPTPRRPPRCRPRP
jgi:hypothetical protein